jgi:hypothetical protein
VDRADHARLEQSEVVLGELREGQVEPTLPVERGDLVLELEPLEDVDVGTEPGDVADQVRSQALGVAQQLDEVELAGVGEPVPGLLRTCASRAPPGDALAKVRIASRSGSRMQSRRRRIVNGRITPPY